MDLDKALEMLYMDVYAPVFFQKLAEKDILPANEKQAAQLLETAAKLQLLAAGLASQEQEDQGETLEKAASALDEVLGLEEKRAASAALPQEFTTLLAAQPHVKEAAAKVLLEALG